MKRKSGEELGEKKKKKKFGIVHGCSDDGDARFFISYIDQLKIYKTHNV